MKEVKLKNTVFTGFEVQQTTDISLFKDIESNRKASYKHIDGIAKSMGKKMLFSPIYTNESMGVVDGQHRLGAYRKRLAKGEPVVINYIVFNGMNYGANDVSRYNTNSKNWSFANFMDSHIKQQNAQVIAANEYLNYCSQISRGAAIYLLTGTTSLSELKSGEIKFTEQDVIQAKNAYDCLVDFKAAKLGFWKELTFIKAVKRLVTDVKYEHEIMKFGISSMDSENFINRKNKVDNYHRALLDFYTKVAIRKTAEMMKQINEYGVTA